MRMSFFYRTIVEGRYEGQAIKNILWYQEVNDLILDMSQAVLFRSEVAKAVAFTLESSYAFLTDLWEAPTISTNVYDAAGVKIDAAPAVTVTSLIGSDINAANGPGDYLVINFDLDLNTGFGVGPVKGYVAWGPVPENQIQADGQHTFTVGQQGNITGPFAENLFPIVSPQPSTQWVLKPVRVRLVVPPVGPFFSGNKDVIGAVMRPFASSFLSIGSSSVPNGRQRATTTPLSSQWRGRGRVKNTLPLENTAT